MNTRQEISAAALVDIPAEFMPARADRLALHETAALAGFEGRWVRMTADTQRKIMGAAPFGRQAFRVLECGDIEVGRVTCFGSDYESHAYAPHLIAKALTEGKKVSPGVSGPGYLW
jgi:hypothetical protein